MSFFHLALNNLLDLPLLCFIAGILVSWMKPAFRLPSRLNQFLTVYILFAIGIKGGGPLVEHVSSAALLFLMTLTALVIWGLVQPIFCFQLLKTFTRVDQMTAAAISASFGSISVMTFITATSFLEHLQVSYQESIIAILAIMEIPAIISGICLARASQNTHSKSLPKLTELFREAVLNKAILALVAGLIMGGVLYGTSLNAVNQTIISVFRPFLCLFLFDLGLHVGLHRQHFRSFSLSLSFFGLYMPLIGGSFGLLLSYCMGLDAGTGTLIAVLTASASYIAVPAAMRIALPQAKEAIYLPLSLGITFPFNVTFGIPIYYQMATRFLT